MGAYRMKIGIVAGSGILPFELVREIKKQGNEALVVGLENEASRELDKLAERYQEISVCRLGEIISTLIAWEANVVVWAGKVGKRSLFMGGFDQTIQRILANLPQKNDDALLLAFVKEFEQNGLKIAKQTKYLSELLVSAGILYGEITTTEMIDVKLGFEMAKAIGGLDIGQSVVIKQGAVLAVEAIEGTDQAIIRGGKLGGPGSVVVKVSKPNQDERFDVPTVGLTTFESMAQVGATVLAIEAEKTFFLDRNACLAMAEANKIKIIAL